MHYRSAQQIEADRLDPRFDKPAAFDAMVAAARAAANAARAAGADPETVKRSADAAAFALSPALPPSADLPDEVSERIAP